jgi:hypothetical protein
MRDHRDPARSSIGHLGRLQGIAQVHDACCTWLNAPITIISPTKDRPPPK